VGTSRIRYASISSSLSAPWAARKVPRRRGVKLAVGGFDDEDKAVISDAFVAGVVEDRVVEPGQTVEADHPEDGDEGRQQDGQLKNDGHRGFQRKERFAGNDERIVNRPRPPLQEDGDGEAYRRAAQDEVTEDGRLGAHGIVDAVDGEGRIGLHLRVAGLAGGPDGVHQFVRRIKIRH
jgi:hypothetical protein